LLSGKENSSRQASKPQHHKRIEISHTKHRRCKCIRRLRIQRAVVPSLKTTKRGLIKPVEVYNCAIIGACHLSQKHKPQKPIADSG
jgi:hypothetical protein